MKDSELAKVKSYVSLKRQIATRRLKDNGREGPLRIFCEITWNRSSYNNQLLSTLPSFLADSIRNHGYFRTQSFQQRHPDVKWVLTTVGM